VSKFLQVWWENCQGKSNWNFSTIRIFRDAVDTKKPRSIFERGLPKDRKPHYLFLLLDAFSGLIFAFTVLEAEATCEARLQLPTFHFKEGSGYAVQYQADENSTLRLQPLHCSTISWQIPPL
jgi:hypothetical protein